jgi:hypothetical protein
VDEAIRLAELRALRILDTPTDERFDRLARLAAQVFGVPMAFLSFVDECRQWFKSALGASMVETSRDVSFCGHTILDEGVLVVRDAASDERFEGNPLVTGPPYIRFYAGFAWSTVLRATRRSHSSTRCATSAAWQRPSSCDSATPPSIWALGSSPQRFRSRACSTRSSASRPAVARWRSCSGGT